MKKLVLFLFLFTALEGTAQPGYSLKKNRGKLKLIINDSILANLQKFKDSIQKTVPATDSFKRKENIDQNVAGIAALQKKQDARAKRAAMIRIGIGLTLLILLIAGLRRKTAKK